MAPGLGHSASAPSIGGSSLQNAGLTLGGMTTNLYAKMQAEGKFRDAFPSVQPAGKSTTVPLADSAERDLQSEIYFPLPSTPSGIRKFRRMSHNPGEIMVHHGLKQQRLPGDEFRYGTRSVKGFTTEDTMKAGMLLGVAEYKNSVAERHYESAKREPIGKPFYRGHELVMLSQGFGKPSGVPINGKEIIYPADGHVPESAESRALYRKTHNSFDVGEKVDRQYDWPEETKEKTFRFGAAAANAISGAGARGVLTWDVDDEGNLKNTRMVQKVCEDYRDVVHPKLFEKSNVKQGTHLFPADHRFGIKSGTNAYSAASCIKGYYSLEEQLPDQDLGRCTKKGRRNVTTETRAFGAPSVRTDIPAPPVNKRSVADIKSYGDEPSATALLCPQRFDSLGVSDREFLVRRPRDELKALVESVNMEGVDFDTLWEECIGLFDDGLPLVSLDALLYLQAQRIEQRVHRTLSLGSIGLGTSLAVTV